jgi:PAS domain S-box-containing protein
MGTALSILPVYMLTIMALRHDPSRRESIGDTLMLLANLTAGVTLGVAAWYGRRRSRRLGIAWGAMAAAQLFSALGDMVGITLGWPIDKTISVADFFYLSAYSLYIIGIGSFCTLPPDPMERQELLLDAGIVILSSFVIFWNLLFGPMVMAGAAVGAEGVLLIIYPTADMLLLWALLMLALRRMRYRNQQPIRLLTAGCAILALSNMLVGYRILVSAAHDLVMVDIGYIIGYTLYGLAGVIQVGLWQRNESERIEPPVSPDMSVLIRPLYLPYIWLAAVFLLLIWGQINRLPMSNLSLSVSVAFIIALVVIRQILALRDNIRLSHALRLQLAESDRMGEELLKARHDLERRVQKRTEELRQANRALSDEIVEHRRAQKALRDSELRYRIITEHMSDTIWLLDKNLKTVFASPSVERFCGHAQSEGAPPSLYEQVSPESLPAFRQTLQELLEAPSSAAPTWRTLEVELMRRDGSSCWNELTLSLVRDDLGRTIGVLCAGRDITDRRHLEAQVRQAQKMEAMGRLAGGVAHDFNNLLMVMNGYAQMVLESARNGESVRPEDAQEIVEAGERAAALTRQLLAFSRRQPMEFCVLNLNDVLTGMHKMISSLIGDNMQLHLDLAQDLGQVKADPGQMEQVVMNLAVNARDAMPTGGVLTVTTANVQLDPRAAADIGLEAGRYVLLSVCDTGVGMTDEIREHLFEPFFTTKEPSKGTGLGLSTTYGIVRQSGGQIVVHSTPGHGARFDIYLPRTHATVMDESASLSSPGGSETVLVVEDRDEVRRLAIRMLESLGYHVLEAACGVDALALVQSLESPPDLILADLAMPGMDGEETVERIIEYSQTTSPPRVLYMSGYLAGEVAPNHGTPFIQKPFTLHTLAQSVRDALNHTPDRTSE